MVPVRQPVNDDVVLTRLTEIERFDVDSLNVERQRVVAVLYLEVELLQQGLVTDRPADVGAK